MPHTFSRTVVIFYCIIFFLFYHSIMLAWSSYYPNVALVSWTLEWYTWLVLPWKGLIMWLISNFPTNIPTLLVLYYGPNVAACFFLGGYFAKLNFDKYYVRHTGVRSWKWIHRMIIMWWYTSLVTIFFLTWLYPFASFFYQYMPILSVLLLDLVTQITAIFTAFWTTWSLSAPYEDTPKNIKL